MELSQEAREARRAYKRRWREKNRERIREYDRKWRKRNPDKVKEYERRRWEKEAAMRTLLIEEEKGERFNGCRHGKAVGQVELVLLQDRGGNP